MHVRVVARREQTPAGEPMPTRKPALARVPCETKRGTSRCELLEPSDPRRAFESSEPMRAFELSEPTRLPRV